MLVLLAWGTLLFYIGGHLVRDSEQPEHPSRELSKILAKLERLKHQNEELRRMAETLRLVRAFSKCSLLVVPLFCSPPHPNSFMVSQLITMHDWTVTSPLTSRYR